MTVAGRPVDSPYVGPRPFEAGRRLFGRDDEVRDLRDLLVAERIVLFYSPSGAGKTSLIQAGLGPTLTGEGFTVRPIIRVALEPSTIVETPASGHNRYVLSALFSLESGGVDADRLLRPETAAMDLPTYLDARPPADGANGLEVLIFDQFEEILTTNPSDEEARREFFEQVGDALRNRRRWALFSLREDYIAGLDPYAHLVPTELRARFRLDLLDKSGALEAVRGPAEAAGAHFTSAAAARLVDDLCKVRVQQTDGRIVEQAGQYVEPVQLQVVCLRIWRGRNQESGAIDLNDLGNSRDLSNVDAALAEYYAERVAALAAETATPEQEIRRWVERSLITAHGIRGQVLLEPERSQGLANEVIQGLEHAHLVRGDRRRGATWYELAHDRLIKPVQHDNAAWLETHLSMLQRRAALWESQGRPAGLLLVDADLDLAATWADSHANEVTDIEQQFLALSWAAERAAQRERRTNRWIRLLASTLAVISVAAISAMFVALWALDREKTTQAKLDEAMRELYNVPVAAQVVGLPSSGASPEPIVTPTMPGGDMPTSTLMPTVAFGSPTPAAVSASPTPAVGLTTPTSTLVPVTPSAIAGRPWNLWPVGSTLRIRFLDGSTEQRAKVEQFAREWERYAKITFDFGDDPAAEIRISFARPGVWGFVGTTARSIARDQPTINLGSLTGQPSVNTSDQDLQRFVLRQFGFMLGLINEHQQPNADIKWDREAVYRYYSYLSRADIERQFFQKYSADSLPPYRQFDPKSVMMLPILKQFTLDGFEAGVNGVLSDSDKSFIGTLYPFP